MGRNPTFAFWAYTDLAQIPSLDFPSADFGESAESECGARVLSIAREHFVVDDEGIAVSPAELEDWLGS